MKAILCLASILLIISCGSDDSQNKEEEGPIVITKQKFVDNPEMYLNKEVKIQLLGYYQGFQVWGEYDYRKDINLRCEDDEFENSRSGRFFKSYIKPEDGNKYYFRTVEVQTRMYITLKIPKDISKKIPNTFVEDLDVTGRVLSTDLILVSSIKTTF